MQLMIHATTQIVVNTKTHTEHIDYFFHLAGDCQIIARLVVLAQTPQRIILCNEK